MKHLLRKATFALLLSGSLFVASAQEKYTQVYIPTSFPGVRDGINPYQISTAIQKEFIDKGIATTFNKSTDSETFCQELQVAVEKVNNLLRTKLNIKLVDCMGNVVWENEGTGMSKDFVAGYAEAVADAMKDLTELPAVQGSTVQPVRTLPAIASRNKTIYYSEKYILELKDNELIVLNSEKLGYASKQVIGKLELSDLEGLYEVNFTMPDGEVWSGMAMLKNDELSLSIAKDGEKQKIVLHKQ
ncbi:MAG: hypothetical protein ACK5JS_03675 [Mangrovibacterium sp.]